MLAPTEARAGCRGRWRLVFDADMHRLRHRLDHYRGMSHRRLGGGGGDQVQVRVIAAAVLADDADAGSLTVVWRGIGGAVMLCRVVVSEAVTHFRQEECYRQEEGDQ